MARSIYAGPSGWRSGACATLTRRKARPTPSAANSGAFLRSGRTIAQRGMAADGRRDGEIRQVASPPPGGLDGTPERAQQMNVTLTRTRALLVVLALAMAVAPVRAAERQPDTTRPATAQELKPNLPQTLPLPSARQAQQGLERL